MTNPEMTERGQIVAWLRAEADAILGTSILGGKQGLFDGGWKAVAHNNLQIAANAIERGDHLQESASVER